MNWRIVSLLFAAFHLQASLCDEPLSGRARRAQEVMEGFDAMIEQALQDYRVPGVAMGVIADGHLVYAKGFGFRDLKNSRPVTPRTLFAIGSCTKAFTAFACGMLVDEGLMHWDQDVIEILPEFRLYDQYATQNLTIRDLLTHRTGLPRHDLMWYNAKTTREEIIRKVRFLAPSCDLREWYQYNNLMYLVAGYAVERLVGKDWEDVISENILRPLQMNRTHFSVLSMQKDEDVALPYLEKGGHLKEMHFRDISLMGPAGSMNSCVEDLSRWLLMQLNSGVWQENALIRSATLQEMHASQVIMSGTPYTDESLISAYGIGWGISAYRGEYFLNHDGGIDGFTSLVGLLPHRGIGVVVLVNKNLTPLARAIGLQAIDRVLELPPIDWIHRGLESVQKARETANKNQVAEDLLRKKGTSYSHPLEDYIGDYEHPGYGTIAISLQGGRLLLTYNEISFFLDHWHFDVFSLVEQTEDALMSLEGMKVAFRNNIRGDIDELSLPLEPKIDDIVFKRKRRALGHSTLSYLHRYTGLYEIFGYTVEVMVRDQMLCASIPGQPLFELVPSTMDHEFLVKSMNGYSARFVMNPKGDVEEVLLVQPFGALTAKPKQNPLAAVGSRKS